MTLHTKEPEVREAQKRKAEERRAIKFGEFLDSLGGKR
jgi:hypothetical protein